MGEMLVRYEPDSAIEVRRELALDLDLRGIDADAIDDITLVTSELVGNAIRHGSNGLSGAWTVSWSVRPGEVVVSVEDPSDVLPVLRHAPPDAPGGRGLAIVAALSAEWGVERIPGGKRVWARVRV